MVDEIKMETKKVILKATNVEFKDFLLLLKKYNWFLYSNLEIEPSDEGFTDKFGATYWYLQYHLLRDNVIEIDNDDLLSLANERNIIFIWISLKTENNQIKIKLIDGVKWEIEYDSKLDISHLLPNK